MSDRPLNILSIQSHVAYGHVGNAAAVFPMQRLGCEVWPIHTVQLSNHPGYGSFRGEVFGPGLIDACVAGIAERGALSRCDGILSGYMGSAEIGAAILRGVERTRAANPHVVYCCDPVIGDVDRGVYVRADLPEFIRDQALKSAHIATPNQFELGHIAGFETPNLAAVARALGVVHAAGPKIILVTSIETQGTPADAIDLLVSGEGRLWRVRTPRLARSFNGAGDAMAALFLVHWLRSRSAPESLARAASALFGVLRHTMMAREREIAVVAAQSEFVSPSVLFRPEPVDVR